MAHQAYLVWFISEYVDCSYYLTALIQFVAVEAEDSHEGWGAPPPVPELPLLVHSAALPDLAGRRPGQEHLRQKQVRET